MYGAGAAFFCLEPKLTHLVGRSEPEPSKKVATPQRCFVGIGKFLNFGRIWTELNVSA